jgi:hypothetical protein
MPGLYQASALRRPGAGAAAAAAVRPGAPAGRQGRSSTSARSSNKLHLHNRAQLAAYALRHGLVDGATPCSSER